MPGTLADLMRSVGIRPAWESLPGASQPRIPMRQPVIRQQAPPPAAPYFRQQALQDLGRGRDLGAMDQRNQIAEAGRGALEMTGLPSVRRSARAFASGDPREGAAQAGLGALGVAGMATLAPRPRMPVRAPVRSAPQPRAQAPDARQVAAPAPQQSVTSDIDGLLHRPFARFEHGETAARVNVPNGRGGTDLAYDFRDSPALTQVFFRPETDGQTFAITMSARGVRADSPMRVKAQAFADAMAAIENHAMRNHARTRAYRYIFAGETDAHTRLFRGLAERATWPRGAVVHDSPGGFEISFDPARAPFSQRAQHSYAFDPEWAPNLGQDGARLRLSDEINRRARQLRDGRNTPPRPERGFSLPEGR